MDIYINLVVLTEFFTMMIGRQSSLKNLKKFLQQYSRSDSRKKIRQLINNKQLNIYQSADIMLQLKFKMTRKPSSNKAINL